VRGVRDDGGLLVKVGLVAIMPFLFSKAWLYTDNAKMRDVMFRQGVIRQALISPDDPLLEPFEEDYRRAVGESKKAGNFYSGVRSDLLGPLKCELFSQSSVVSKSSAEFFVESVLKNPLRYLKAVGRCFALYGGAKALENEIHFLRYAVLSVPHIGLRIQGDDELATRIRKEFGQPSRESLLAAGLNRLIPAYDQLVIVGSAITLLGLVLGLCLRNVEMTIVCVMPLVFVVLPAIILASIDRYAFPTYPVTLANTLIVPILCWREITKRWTRG